jgi:23S rRNA (guanosine2251-2'-O)-methyltransferase
MKEHIFSRNAVREALRSSRREVQRVLISESAQETGRVQEISELAARRGVPVEHVTRARLDKIHMNHQGIAAEVGQYSYADLLEMLDLASSRGEAPFLLVLDALQDPQNFGTLLRTAEAVGVHGVIIPLAHTVEVTPAVVNSSSGATEHMLIGRSNLAQALDAVRAENVWVVGLDQAGQPFDAQSQRHLQGPLALVVGSEGEGIRALVRSKCDVLLGLPMKGQLESLNASAAGSVMLYLAFLARQKGRVET